MRKQIYVRIANLEIQHGYVTKLNAGPQVYLGNRYIQAIVPNRYDKGYLYTINASDEDIELATVDIYPIKERDDILIKGEIDDVSFNKETPVLRKEIMQLLRLDHLNEKDKANVTRLIIKQAE